MIHFSYKAVKNISLCCTSFFLLSLAPSQDIPLLKRVQEYWKEGDYSLAKKQILAYLEKNPHSEITEELHLLLGDLYVQEGNFLTALEEYSLLEKRELQNKVFYNKALCLYEENKPHELLSLCDKINEHPSLTQKQINSIRYLTASSLFDWKNTHEKETRVLSKIIELFELCQGTEFEVHALPPLVEVYLMQGEKTKAAECYLSFAKSNQEQSSNLIFSAALLLTEENPERALDLFKQVLALNSPQKGEATYNTIALQYTLKQFKDVLFTYEVYAEAMNDRELKKASLLIGKSLYYLKDYKEASAHLLKVLNDKTIEEQSKKKFYLMALECAYRTEDISLYQEIRQNFPAFAKDDSEVQVQLAYLNLLKIYNKNDELIQESDLFLQTHNASPESEAVQLDRITALYERKKWKETEESLSSFLKKYPSSSATQHLERLQINCAAARLQESSGETAFILREHWIDVLEKALAKDNLLSANEKKSYFFELTKNLFLQDRFLETLETSKKLLAEYPEASESFELQLIITLCYLKDPDAKSLFAFHAEKLIASYPDASDVDSFRVHLFNTYLQLCNESSVNEKNELLGKAAAHLYLIFEKNEKDLQVESVEWLAQYYYEKAKMQEPESLDKAIYLFEALLSPSYRTKEQDESEIEMHVYKLGKLFSMASLHEKKIDLLEDWIRSHRGVTTPIQKHLIFDLAENHKALGHFEEAISLYDTLIKSGESSLLGSSSVLERAKLLFAGLSEEERSESNPTCVDILCNLKEIEAKRTPSSEPLHLEAGLEYAFCKIDLLENKNSRKEKAVELLHLFQENFRSAEEYNQKNLQDKWPMLNAYMQFAEAKILQYEANSPEELKEYTLRLEELEKATTTPEPLKKRILLSLQEQNKTL
jgi:hypothetical protein